MKKLIIILLIVLLSSTAFAHSGRTDSSGGHNRTSNGTYHYHNGGGGGNIWGLVALVLIIPVFYGSIYLGAAIIYYVIPFLWKWFWKLCKFLFKISIILFVITFFTLPITIPIWMAVFKEQPTPEVKIIEVEKKKPYVSRFKKVDKGIFERIMEIEIKPKTEVKPKPGPGEIGEIMPLTGLIRGIEDPKLQEQHRNKRK
jgi:hypothetical protein